MVVLGSGGFVGGALVERLKWYNAAVLALTRSELDLLDNGAADRLASLLKPTDALVVISARGPCKIR